VMNTGEQIRQALDDYRRGSFEAAKVTAL
jgi:redox-sensitive bicupin YhaK (pirin superfamily)